MATEFSVPAPAEIDSGAREAFDSPSTGREPSLIAFTLLRTAVPIVLDLVCIATACFAGIMLYQLHQPLAGQRLFSLWLQVCFRYAPAFIMLAQAHHLYTQRATLLQVADTASVLKVSVYSLALLCLGAYFTGTGMPRLLLLYFWTLVTVLLVVQKHATKKLIRNWKAIGSRQRRVLIYGANRETRRLFSFLLHSPHLGQIPVGFVDETGFARGRIIYSHDYNLKHHAPVFTETLTQSLLRSLDVKELFVTHTVAQTRMVELLELAAATGVKVNLVGAGHPHLAEHCSRIMISDGLIVTTFDAEAEMPALYLLWKQATDVLLSGLLIFLTLPLWLVVAILVKSTSKGPVFFRQERMGQGGRPFTMLKFRSMYVSASTYERSPESATDERITSAGRFLRKTSLDELPQLLNVLKRNMSLVGPRPEMPYITDTYTSLERRRLSVPQGITGLWQLSGDRKFTIHQAIEYDLYYIENRGIFLDLAILLHTLIFAMKGL